jgi:hypothetical protein
LIFASVCTGLGTFAVARTREVAETWVTRWELQQPLYATARDERFHVIGDIVAHRVHH